VLISGYLAAHETYFLVLLPSGPDTVQSVSLRKTKNSSHQTSDCSDCPALTKELNLALADCELQGTATSPSSTVKPIIPLINNFSKINLPCIEINPYAVSEVYPEILSENNYLVFHRSDFLPKCFHKAHFAFESHSEPILLKTTYKNVNKRNLLLMAERVGFPPLTFGSLSGLGGKILP
jgi:hypothetical protein